MAKKTKRLMALVAITTLLLALVIVGQGLAQPPPPTIEDLGENLYFDQNLSEPNGQSCSDCHLPRAGFVDPDSNFPVSQGVFLDRFGDRNSPASAYAMYAPLFHWDDEEGLFIGGQFWDGRATGEVLDDPLADQALGPFLNKVEMANDTKAEVIADVAGSDYADLFRAVWGPDSLEDVETAYDQVAQSIAAFERTALFGQFSSKYDHYLQACLAASGNLYECAKGIGDVAAAVGTEVFTNKEWQGFQLFMNENNNNDGILEPGEGAMCVLCHVADWVDPADYGELSVVVPDWTKAYFPPDGRVPPVFTDFTYDNLGVPKNWDNPFLYQDPAFNPLGEDFVDRGLYRFLVDREDLWPSREDHPLWSLDDEDGKFKVMTLRNIADTGPWAHNGLFKSLKDITHFYNTRDVPEEMWPPPEVPETINVEELGNLGLSKQDEKNLVKFMRTLSDGWTTP